MRRRPEGVPVEWVEEIRNPFPAAGGTDPEGVRGPKLSGRNIERGDLVRAVTPDDYSALVMRFFGDRVQRAVADFRELGTWTEVRIADKQTDVYDPPGRD